MADHQCIEEFAFAKRDCLIRWRGKSSQFLDLLQQFSHDSIRWKKWPGDVKSVGSFDDGFVWFALQLAGIDGGDDSIKNCSHGLQNSFK